VAQVEGDAGEQMGSADRGEADAQGADRAAVVGAADQEHGDGVGIAGQRISAQALAPLGEKRPGGAVGTTGAIAAGAGGIDGSPAGQVRQVLDADRAGWHRQLAEQAGIEQPRPLLPCPVGRFDPGDHGDAQGCSDVMVNGRRSAPG
jgi:hypothetical protein